MGDDRNIRHRFTVPKDDDMVEEWIQAQSNLGFSLRVLIRAFVRSYGVRDATCMELGTSVKRVGRPPKQAQIALGNMMEQGGAIVDQVGAGQLFPPEPEEEELDALPASRPPQQAVPARQEVQETEKQANPLNAFASAPGTAQRSIMDEIMGLDS